MGGGGGSSRVPCCEGLMRLRTRLLVIWEFAQDLQRLLHSRHAVDVVVKAAVVVLCTWDTGCVGAGCLYFRGWCMSGEGGTRLLYSWL